MRDNATLNINVYNNNSSSSSSSSATATTTDPTVTSVRSTWSSVHGLPCPSGVIAHRQSSWVITSERETLTSSLSDSSDKARLQAVRAPHSGDWLNALPLSACGLRLDDNTIHIAVGLQLGANHISVHASMQSNDRRQRTPRTLV